jgi:hypothetical protein
VPQWWARGWPGCDQSFVTPALEPTLSTSTPGGRALLTVHRCPWLPTPFPDSPVFSSRPAATNPPTPVFPLPPSRDRHATHQHLPLVAVSPAPAALVRTPRRGSSLSGEAASALCNLNALAQCFAGQLGGPSPLGSSTVCVSHFTRVPADRGGRRLHLFNTPVASTSRTGGLLSARQPTAHWGLPSSATLLVWLGVSLVAHLLPKLVLTPAGSLSPSLSLC